MALPARLERAPQLGDRQELGDVGAGRRVPGVDEQDRIVAAGAMAQDVADPVGEGCGVADVAVADRPFEAVAVGVAADREGRRQPGEEFAEGGRRKTAILRVGA